MINIFDYLWRLEIEGIKIVMSSQAFVEVLLVMHALSIVLSYCLCGMSIDHFTYVISAPNILAGVRMRCIEHTFACSPREGGLCGALAGGGAWVWHSMFAQLAAEGSL